MPPDPPQPARRETGRCPSSGLLANKRREDSSGWKQYLIWDDDGRLAAAETNGKKQSNLYDASGLRVIRNGGSETIYSSIYFDLEGGQSGVKHVFAGDMRVASVLTGYHGALNPPSPPSHGEPYYFHSDHLGSTAVVTDKQGAPHQSLEFFVDGEPWIDRAPSSTVAGTLFTGKPLDPDTKLYDFGQRFYDPRTSLFLGTDPAFASDASGSVGRPVVLSASAYAANSPSAAVDPDGRDYLWKRVQDGKVSYTYVAERYGPNAGGSGLSVIEGPYAGIRFRQENLAAYRHDQKMGVVQKLEENSVEPFVQFAVEKAAGPFLTILFSSLGRESCSTMNCPRANGVPPIPDLGVLAKIPVGPGRGGAGQAAHRHLWRL